MQESSNNTAEKNEYMAKCPSLSIYGISSMRPGNMDLLPVRLSHRIISPIMRLL